MGLALEREVQRCVVHFLMRCAVVVLEGMVRHIHVPLH